MYCPHSNEVEAVAHLKGLEIVCKGLQAEIPDDYVEVVVGVHNERGLVRGQRAVAHYLRPAAQLGDGLNGSTGSEAGGTMEIVGIIFQFIKEDTRVTLFS